MVLKILPRPLPYFKRLEYRSIESIRLVVLHCTELPDLNTARTWGEKEIHAVSRTGNSGHFYIDRDGLIEEWVPINRIAHHVGGYNPTSIGIELVNDGRYPDWFHSGHQRMTEPYPHTQIKALMFLLHDLCKKLPGLAQIAGHEDLDITLIPADDNPNLMIRRKLDPGPRFPWQDVLCGVALKRYGVKT